MACYYLDTSALVKRYAQESGTTWIVALTQYGTSNELYTVHLTGPEAVSALFRKARGGTFSQSEARRLTNNFLTDWQCQYDLLDVSLTVIGQAMLLAEKHILRGADAVHLAAALDLQQVRQLMQLSPLTFVSADIEQLHAAQAEGLLVENPDNYT